MPWKPREQSEGNLYHVGSRGVGLQTIFEDDADRRYFVDLIERYLEEALETPDDGGSALQIIAWCLMDNHFHLIVRADKQTLSKFMMRLLRAYSYHFNERHARTGQLYQGHFWSEPIKTDEQLLATIRYVHQNPWKAGIANSCEWPWSSYGEYVGRQAITSIDFVLGMFDGADPQREFADFCSQADFGAAVRDGNERHPAPSDDEARSIAFAVLGETTFREIASLPKAERNEALAQLKKERLSVRQIERLTGIGRSIISRA